MPHDDPTPDLTPEEEQVRRLLADARHIDPMPDDVADRLDAVLADLRDDPAVHVGTPLVTRLRTPADLAAARRRRNVRTWLVAAAAVVVVGVGVNQLDLSGMGSDDDAADSATSAEVEGGAAGSAGEPGTTSGARQVPVRLDPDRFGAQVAALQDDHRRTLASSGATAAESAPSLQSDRAETPQDLDGRDGAAYSALCDTGRLGAGRLVPVRYDGEAGWLVFRKPQGDTQVVDLFLCGHDEPTRSITLSAP